MDHAHNIAASTSKPTTATAAAEKQKILLQREIAKLSGAITRHASGSSHPSSYHPYATHRGNASRQAVPRAGRVRGRGKGSYSLDLRQTNQNQTSNTTPQKAPQSAVQSDKNFSDLTKMNPADKWVKKTTRGGNMSLMTVEKREQLKSQPRPTKSSIPPQIQVLQSSTTTSPGSGEPSKRVVIDGVIFQFEQGGAKLTRIGELSTPGGHDKQGSTSTPTRRSLEYGGEKFRRTKRGNLVSRRPNAATRRAEQAKRPCRYYTKTGRCERALTCPYLHIPDRLAICPQFLRSTCPFTAGSCSLSHEPSAHNTPSCVHFQATSTCRNGSDCLYPHVRVAEDARVCEPFSREGWCDREPGTCPDLHVWECGEWRENGTCSRGNKCGLRHVIRGIKGKASIEEANRDGLERDQEIVNGNLNPPVEGEFEEQAEFIGFDPGHPGQVYSDDDSETDEEGDDEDEDDDDDDKTKEEEDEEVGEDEEDEDDEEEGGDGRDQDMTDSPSSDSRIDDDEAELLIQV